MNKILITFSGVLLVWSPIELINNSVSAKNATTIVKKVQKRKKYNKNTIKSYAHNLVLKYGWSEYDYECLVKLWNRESSWNPYAVNKKSGACGIPQAYPCSKASKGTNYKTNWKTQVKWGLNYIKKRYGSPAYAWEQSQRIGWY